MFTAHEEQMITAAVVALHAGNVPKNLLKLFTREMLKELGKRHATKQSGSLYNSGGRKIKDNCEFTIDHNWYA